jgi:hypothetical protein
VDAPSLDLPIEADASCARRARQRRHLIALIVAVAIAGAVFAAYRQPDLLLGFSAFGLC